MMGGHDPCCHCGTVDTPCWRKGPAEKPNLCNACGSRFLVKQSLEGYFPGAKQRSSSKHDGVAKHRSAKPKTAGMKRKAADGHRRMPAAVAAQQLEWSQALAGAPAFFFPQQLYSSFDQRMASSGSSDSESMEHRARDDLSSDDSQEVPRSFASAVAAVAELLQQQQRLNFPGPPLFVVAQQQPTKHCASRIRPRKQTHPTMCC